MNNKKNEKNKDNLLEGKQKQSRPFLKGKTYPSQNLNKYPPDNEDYLDSNISHQKKNLRSYLDIFHRPSFRNLNRNIQANYDLNTPFISEQEEKETDKKYDYPVNIFKRLVYTWTRKVLSASNSKPNLEISDLGRFHPDLHPDKFLSDIKPVWDKVSKRTKNYPLIKTLLIQNIWMLILIAIGNFFILLSSCFDVLLYRQVLLHLDKEPESEPWFSLLTTMILLLLNKFTYNFYFRYYETYTVDNSYRIITQLDSLIYDKLLRTSLYANISEGSVVNFIQIDAESFAEFFTYIPATFALPFQTVFYIYLLFKYFGVAFLFSLLSLVIILIISSYLQKLRTKYQQIVLEKKDRRMRTLTQAFQIIKIIKLYSWEKYFTNKITNERNDELKYFKKINIINVFINCMFWLTGPIMSFVSICAYNIIYDKMNLSNILTGLFIFYLLADPLFLLPEYINGLVDSLLSLKRIEIFLNKKEYNPKELVKNINSNQNAKFAIEIDGLDFGIIKKREEFEKDETENEINENKDDKKEIELKDIDLRKYEKEKDEKIIKLLSKDNHINNKKEIKEENKNEIKLEVKESKNEENIPEIEIIDLLYDIKLKVEKGDLIGIVGPIGAGKTCLLNAILNNLDALNNPDSKKIKINGSIAYIPQKAWILNDTIKNNILFKHPFNAEKYDIVIKLCQLLPDFDLFKQGDLTMISDKGANLSGGQKTRINIARAVYSDSDIYLFDDPLSALDSHVGEAIFTDLIKNYLRNKTVLVVTHALQYIPMMNKVLYMDDGKILFYGKPEDAMNLPFFKNALSLEERKKFSELSRKQGKSRGKKMKEFEETEQESFSSSDLHLMIKKKKKKEKEDLVVYKEPTKIQSFRIIFSYCGGCIFLFCVILLCILWRINDSISDFIIVKWSSLSDDSKPEYNYFNIYLFTKLIGILLVFLRSYIVINGLVEFNKRMHKTLLEKLMRAPINLFHDIVNKSHILNRFSKDLENSIKYFHSFNYALTLLFNSLNAIFIAIIFYWKSIFIIPILIFLQNHLYNYYKKCAKKLFVLESYTRLPIISGFSETLAGLSSIRCYDYEEKFRKDYHQKLHNFYRVLIYQNGTLSWFALNIDLIAFCLLFFILLIAYFMRNTASASAIGVLLSYVLKLIEKNFYFYEQFNINERMSRSLESCEAYTHIVQEAPLVLKSDKDLYKINYPKTGKIEFRNYSVKYRPDTKIILKNLTFVIKSGEKIGIVGRTGSGKSTLCLCLFRILEPTFGKILIDDVDITKIGLSLLREIITVIPQDPTLIEGTLRENLDPAGKFTDEEMISNMNLIGLAYLIEEKGLDLEIKEDGKNLSVGEKQLICMVRAILRKSKIIIMDEATSSVDYNTESLIQNTILNNLKGSTILTIAHRIKTILSYDRIFVLDKGELIEEGSPKQLIDKKGSFYQLYSKSNV